MKIFIIKDAANEKALLICKTREVAEKHQKRLRADLFFSCLRWLSLSTFNSGTLHFNVYMYLRAINAGELRNPYNTFSRVYVTRELTEDEKLIIVDRIFHELGHDLIEMEVLED